MIKPPHPDALKPGDVRVVDGEEYACVVLKCTRETVNHLSEAVPCRADICGGRPFKDTTQCISSEHDSICRCNEMLSAAPVSVIEPTAPIIVPLRVVHILALHGDLA